MESRRMSVRGCWRCEMEEARENNPDSRGWDAAIAAWDSYVETGLHLTGEEVESWLASLEAGCEVEAPAPHR
jgi:predicted transcriptional regulator